MTTYYGLPDADRWQQAIRFFRSGSTPTTDAVERAVAYSNFHLHLAAPWTGARERDGQVEASITGDTYRLDFVIAGTGYSSDLMSRPELGDFAGQALLWRDSYTPPPEEHHATLGLHPYLGAGHELLARSPGTAPLLKHIHVQNPSGFLSFGLPIGDVPSMKRDIPVVVSRISADFFQADLTALRRRMTGDVPPDFSDALYRHAIR